MSQGIACKHKPRKDHIVVTMRMHNRSAFNGYRWTPSDYSEVRCLTCGNRWRTKAEWVHECRDATREQDIGANPTPLLCTCPPKWLETPGGVAEALNRYDKCQWCRDNGR